MNTRYSLPARTAIPALSLAFALALLSACAPRTGEAPPSAPARTDSPASSAAPAVARPEKLLGPAFTLIDKLDRPMECVILAKQGSQVLVRRTSDKTLYAIDFDRLSPDTQRLLGAYPDENTEELRTFVNARDYAEAKRNVRVEMISATWCGYCTQAKNFFGAEGITYAAYDHESFSGKQRKKEWNSDSLPTVKIGDRIINGFNKEAYVNAVLEAYRKQLAAAPRP